MIDWFDYHGHMCIVFEMLGLSVFDFLVSGLLKQKWTINTLIVFFFTAREQLWAIPAGPSAPYGLSIMLLCEISTWQSFNAHRSQAGEHTLRRLGLYFSL